jgi:hypothetical protein
MKHMEQPLNSTENFLYGINMRLEVIIEQLSALAEHIGEKDGVAVASETSKTLTAEEERKEEIAELGLPRKRTRKK